MIKIHYENGLKPKDIHKSIGKTCGLKTIYRWIKRLNQGKFFSVKNSGRPNTSSTPHNIRKIKGYLNENKTVRHISRITKLPETSVRRIVKKISQFKMLSSGSMSLFDRKTKKKKDFILKMVVKM